jgi:integrase
MARTLPRWLHEKHGAYYLVRHNKWRRLAGNLRDALIEYARLTSGPEGGAFGELVSRTLDDLKLTISANTYRVYASCARRVLEAFVEFTPPQVRPYHIARFLDDNKATPGMANSMRTFLNNMFQRAVRWGIVESNPVRDIDKFKIAKRDRYITAEEYQRIREHATPTLACLMDIAYLTGQRIGDCLRIRYADISEDGIFVRQQKTKTRVLIAMTPDLSDAIDKARTLHQSVKGMTLFHRRDGTLIPYATMRDQWRRARFAAGVEDVHFHDIRAAAATDAKAQGLDSKTLLGHLTDSSHNRYLRSKEIKVATPNRARKS